MCGRITQKSNAKKLALGLTMGSEQSAVRPRYNGAPGQEQWVIRRHAETGMYSLDRLLWGLIPRWVKDENGGRKPINAKAETIQTLPSFRDAYKKRRCLVPIDNFFEWKATKGASKPPYAIAMKSGEPFALAGIWENWKRPGTEDWVRTFAVITTEANELMRPVHDRMPVIIAPAEYARWLSAEEADPRDLLRPYPSELMTMWPISTRVNTPRNDNPEILEPVDL